MVRAKEVAQAAGEAAPVLAKNRSTRPGFDLYDSLGTNTMKIARMT